LTIENARISREIGEIANLRIHESGWKPGQGRQPKRANLSESGWRQIANLPRFWSI
jgi:hypothetical protein